MKLEITKLTSRGQVVIPQEIREKTGIKEGERFLVYDSDDSIILKKMSGLEAVKNVKEFENVFKSMWNTAKAGGVTKEDVEKEIRAERKEKKCSE